MIKKNSLKDQIAVQFTYVNDENVKTSDKKIHDFSITKLGKRKKTIMSQLIDTIITKAQQNFDIVGGLNPIQIEIMGDRVINSLKKYKNIIYKITPLGILFPSSVTNETSQIFITSKELNGVKKGLLNNKICNLLAVIDLNKISNWADIKGQFIWTNVAFAYQKAINNNSHLCFPFVTRSFSNLANFGIFLQDDKSKKIEFAADKKKISIFNFQIDIFLT